MNADTAEQSARTQKTGDNGIVTGANSQISERIDGFLKRHSALANSEDFSQIESTARSAQRHGFANSANVRYANFLEELRASHPLAVKYGESYPNCFFLSYRAMHGLLKSQDLWLDLPEHYLAGVPSSQIPWLDCFVLEEEDRPDAIDLDEAIYSDDASREEAGKMMCALVHYHVQRDPRRARSESDEFEHLIGKLRKADTIAEASYDRLRRLLEYMSTHLLGWNTAEMIEEFVRKFTSSFFVIAPSAAFNTDKDFIARAKEGFSKAQLLDKPFPNDPLVIRFVKGGALVVAAWGDEASLLNEAVKDAGL